MKNRSVLTGLLLLAAAVVVLAFVKKNPQTEPLQPTNETSPVVVTDTVESSTPTFTWNFKQAKALNPDGNPKTDVYLQVHYPGKPSLAKLIETVDGGCSILPDPEAGSVPGTSSIQCYYAGFGSTYKITKGETSYKIERKNFEEGDDSYTPPQLPYEVIAEIPA